MGENSRAADSFVIETGLGWVEPLGLHYNAYIMLYCKKVEVGGGRERERERGLGAVGKFVLRRRRRRRDDEELKLFAAGLSEIKLVV